MTARGSRSTNSPLPRAVIHQGELDKIGRWVLESPDLETGGELFGLWTQDGTPVVQLVVGPGPRCVREVAEFHQDAAYLEAERDEIVERHGLELIGTWHSHHALGLARPSSGDSNTTAGVFARTSRNRFFLMVANLSDGYGLPDRNGIPWVRGFLYTRRQGTNHRRCYWRVLPGPSPLCDPRSLDAGSALRVSDTLAVRAVPTAPVGARISQLRPGSWVEAPEGVELLAQIKLDLEAVADVSMAPDALGRLQMRLRRDREAWTLTFGSFLSAERATGEIRRDPVGFPIHLFGTLPAVVQQVKSWITRSVRYSWPIWPRPYFPLSESSVTATPVSSTSGSVGDESEKTATDAQGGVRTQARAASGEGRFEAEDGSSGTTEGASSCPTE